MKDNGDFAGRIQAAGSVTIIFGVLVAVIPAAYVVLQIVVGGTANSSGVANLTLPLLFATGFVLLGWGVLRHSRTCAALAGALAAALLSVQLVATFSAGERPSAFVLILSAFVLVANWVAWRQLGQPDLAGNRRP